jgi:hypothetical protein
LFVGSGRVSEEGQKGIATALQDIELINSRLRMRSCTTARASQMKADKP